MDYDDYEPSDHILDNMEPEEELALSIYQQGVAGKVYNPSNSKAISSDFKDCLNASKIISMTLLEVRKEAEEKLKDSINIMQNNNVVSLIKSI